MSMFTVLTQLSCPLLKAGILAVVWHAMLRTIKQFYETLSDCKEFFSTGGQGISQVNILKKVYRYYTTACWYANDDAQRAWG